MLLLDTSDKGLWNRLGKFCAASQPPAVFSRRVASIIETVRVGGDKAVRRCTQKFDGVDVPLQRLRVSTAELASAASHASQAEKDAIVEAISCVTAFHRRSLPQTWRANNPHGARVGENFYPLRRVGINVPAGQVPLVSTVIMTTLLAQMAGVPEIVVCTPPDKSGGTHPGLLAALALCGIREIYRMGGIQAMAALAHGTATIPAVDKLFGPGNAYTTEAKRQLFGIVGIDLLPGPSEVMLLCDDTANPRWAAHDLLAQAEHGTGKERIYLVCTTRKILRATLSWVKRLAPRYSHGNHLDHVLNEGFVAILAKDLADAVEVANYVAPEHLELHVRPRILESLSRKITTAGAILLGAETPAVLGDFTAGPSHVLPTGRTARFFSGLRIEDFMRRSSIVRYDARSLPRAANIVAAFSSLENLPAHADSLKARLKV